MDEMNRKIAQSITTTTTTKTTKTTTTTTAAVTYSSPGTIRCTVFDLTESFFAYKSVNTSIHTIINHSQQQTKDFDGIWSSVSSIADDILTDRGTLGMESLDDDVDSPVGSELNF